MQWINTPVLNEAIIRYQEGNLTRQMKLWVEEVLELKGEKTDHSFSSDRML